MAKLPARKNPLPRQAARHDDTVGGPTLPIRRAARHEIEAHAPGGRPRHAQLGEQPLIDRSGRPPPSSAPARNVAPDRARFGRQGPGPAPGHSRRHATGASQLMPAARGAARSARPKPGLTPPHPASQEVGGDQHFLLGIHQSGAQQVGQEITHLGVEIRTFPARPGSPMIGQEPKKCPCLSRVRVSPQDGRAPRSKW